MHCIRNRLFISLILFLIFFLSNLSFGKKYKDKPIYSGVWKGAPIEYVAGELLIEVAPNTSTSQLDSLLKANSTYFVQEINDHNWGVIGCDTTTDIFALTNSVRKSPFVIYVAPNQIGYAMTSPNDTLFGPYQWALNNTQQSGGSFDSDIDAFEAWQIGKGDTSVIVAILDTGLPMSGRSKVDTLCHRDLMGPKFILGTNWVYPDSEPADFSVESHGSKIAGIIGAVTNNVEGIAGVCWYCKIRAIKIWDDLYQGGPPISNMCNGIKEAYENGCKVINISTVVFTPDSILEKEVRIALDSNCVIVASAGNENRPMSGLPAGYATWGQHPEHLNGYRNVIAVNNYDKYDRRAEKSVWSSDTLKITVAAPGKDTYSTARICPSSYAWFDGTSAAAPHVAGVAALLKSVDLTLTADSIRTIIENTADDVGPPGWDDSSGYGRVNALRALAAVKGWFPNASGHIKVNTTWKDTVYLISDVVVLDTVTLTIDPGTVIKVLPKNYEDWGVDPNKCEIIVKGKLRVNGTADSLVSFVPVNSDSGWYGIRVLNTDSASAKIKYANINYAYAGVTYENSKQDTVRSSHFYNNQMYGIKCGNTNLKILGNVIEKDTTSNYLGYGISILPGKSPVIDSNEIRNYQYGIDKSYSGGTPSITNNLIENGDVGINFSSAGTNTIKKICAKGKFKQAYVKNYGGTLNIDSCYLEGDASNKTPKGLWYIKYAGGYIQRSGVFNYETTGLYAWNSSPYLGGGHNSIYSFVNGGLTTAIDHVGILELDAGYNWWGTTNPDTLRTLFKGFVSWEPYDDSAYTLYNACAPFGGSPKFASSEPAIVENFSLSQNYPNPFNPATTIQFRVGSLEFREPVHTTLKIYNIRGQLVKTLLNEDKLPGEYKVIWDGKDDKGNEVSSGIYFYRVKAGDEVMVKKMILVK